MVLFDFEPISKYLPYPWFGGLLSTLFFRRDFEEEDDFDWVSELKQRAGWPGASDA